jgi:phenylacetate-CoA ligase
MRKTISETLNSNIYDSYGSREIQAMAFECEEHSGLHVSSPLLHFEILRSDGTPTKPGEIGEIVLTPFFNYAMPLIRYRIGDMGSWSVKECPCGRGWPLIDRVVGRVTTCFYKQDGGVVPPEYFIHLIGVVLNDGWIKRFQIIQYDYDRIEVKIVSRNSVDNPALFYKTELSQIYKKIVHVMGERCDVSFNFVDTIMESSSGKYFYTISHVQK